MNKVLMTATYGDFFAAFEVDNIKLLISNGYEVNLCADWHTKEFNYKYDRLSGLEFNKIDIGFKRSPFSLENIKSFVSLYRLIKSENFVSVLANNPVVGIITRLAAKLAHVKKIIYTSHGFQFCKNGPKKDWLLYYPIEWLASFITNDLVVMNNEDFLLAKKHFHNGRVTKIPGVGLDVNKFKPISKDKKDQLRIRYNLFEGDRFVLISTAELIPRKNVIPLIRATEEALCFDKNIILLIVGDGVLRESLRMYVEKHDLSKNIIFLGKRRDIVSLNGVADVAISSTYREGLAMAQLECMAMGLPLISSRARGVVEYSINNYTGYNFDADDFRGMAHAIIELKNNEKKLKFFSFNAKKTAQKFSLFKTHQIMARIYSKIPGD